MGSKNCVDFWLMKLSSWKACFSTDPKISNIKLINLMSSFVRVFRIWFTATFLIKFTTWVVWIRLNRDRFHTLKLFCFEKPQICLEMKSKRWKVKIQLAYDLVRQLMKQNDFTSYFFGLIDTFSCEISHQIHQKYSSKNRFCIRRIIIPYKTAQRQYGQ